MHHFLWLFSAEYSNDLIGNHPHYFLILLSLAFIFSGKLVSFLAQDPNIDSMYRFFLPISITFTIMSAFLLSSPYAPVGTLIESTSWLIFQMGLIFFLIRNEMKFGLVSPSLVIAGIVLLCISGLITPVLEIFRMIGIEIDYLPTYDVAKRKLFVSYFMMVSLGIIAASIDAIVAFCVTGKIFSPLIDSKKILKSGPRRNIFIEFLIFKFKIYLFIFILIGQGYILRFCLWALIRSFPLDAIPFQPLVYPILAFGLHYVMRVKIVNGGERPFWFK